MMTRSFVLAAVASAMLLFPGAAFATSFTLVDQNSTAIIETGAGGGVLAWAVDDVNSLNLQWFFISIDGSDYVPIDLLGVAAGGSAELASDTNPFVDDNEDTLAVRYGDQSPIVVDLTLTLRGGQAGTGVADMAETLVLSNLGDVATSVSFIQYVDFNFGADPGDVAEILNANTVRQQDAAGAVGVAEEVVTPKPDLAAVGSADELLANITSGAGVVPDSGPVGPGDVAWAFQWDVELDGGDTFLISKDKRLGPAPGTPSVPEPATALLGLLGCVGLAVIGRRRA